MGGRILEAVMAFDFLLSCAPLLRDPPERRNRHKVQLDLRTCRFRQRGQEVGRASQPGLKSANPKHFSGSPGLLGGYRATLSQEKQECPCCHSQATHLKAVYDRERPDFAQPFSLREMFDQALALVSIARSERSA
jgi:hypothetical protein